MENSGPQLDISFKEPKLSPLEREKPYNKNISHAMLVRENGDPKFLNQLASELQIAAEERLIHKERKEVKCQLPDYPRSTYLMVFSPDGKKMASCHGNHNVYVTDIKTGKNLNTLSGHPRTPWCIAFHPSSSQILASGCLGGQVRVWDLHGGSEIWTVEGQTSIASLAFHPTDRLLVIASYNELLFWDWSQPEPFAKCRTFDEKEKVRYVAFDQAGSKLITGIENPQPLQSQWDRMGPLDSSSRVNSRGLMRGSPRPRVNFFSNLQNHRTPPETATSSFTNQRHVSTNTDQRFSINRPPASDQVNSHRTRSNGVDRPVNQLNESTQNLNPNTRILQTPLATARDDRSADPTTSTAGQTFPRVFPFSSGSTTYPQALNTESTPTTNDSRQSRNRVMVLNSATDLDGEVRFRMSALSDLIDSMQQCAECQPRIEGSRLGSIRTMWEDLQSEIRALQRSIWENGSAANSAWYRYSSNALMRMMSGDDVILRIVSRLRTQTSSERPNSEPASAEGTPVPGPSRRHSEQSELFESHSELNSVISDNNNSQTSSSFTMHNLEEQLVRNSLNSDSSSRHTSSSPSDFRTESLLSSLSADGIRFRIDESGPEHDRQVTGFTAFVFNPWRLDFLVNGQADNADEERTRPDTAGPAPNSSRSTPTTSSGASSSTGREALQIAWMDLANRGSPAVGVVCRSPEAPSAENARSPRQSNPINRQGDTTDILRNRLRNVFANSTSNNNSESGSSQPPRTRGTAEPRNSTASSQRDRRIDRLDLLLTARGIVRSITRAMRRLRSQRETTTPERSTHFRCRVYSTRPCFVVVPENGSEDSELTGTSRLPLFEITVNATMVSVEDMALQLDEMDALNSVRERHHDNMLSRLFRTLRDFPALQRRADETGNSQTTESPAAFVESLLNEESPQEQSTNGSPLLSSRPTSSAAGSPSSQSQHARENALSELVREDLSPDSSPDRVLRIVQLMESLVNSNERMDRLLRGRALLLQMIYHHRSFLSRHQFRNRNLPEPESWSPALSMLEQRVLNRDVASGISSQSTRGQETPQGPQQDTETGTESSESSTPSGANTRSRPRRWMEYSGPEPDSETLNIRLPLMGRLDTAVNSQFQRIQRTGGVLTVVLDGAMSEDAFERLRQLDAQHNMVISQLAGHEARIVNLLQDNSSMNRLRKELQNYLSQLRQAMETRLYKRCIICGASMYFGNLWRGHRQTVQSQTSCRGRSSAHGGVRKNSQVNSSNRPQQNTASSGESSDDESSNTNNSSRQQMPNFNSVPESIRNMPSCSRQGTDNNLPSTSSNEKEKRMRKRGLIKERASEAGKKSKLETTSRNDCEQKNSKKRKYEDISGCGSEDAPNRKRCNLDNQHNASPSVQTQRCSRSQHCLDANAPIPQVDSTGNIPPPTFIRQMEGILERLDSLMRLQREALMPSGENDSFNADTSTSSTPLGGAQETNALAATNRALARLVGLLTDHIQNSPGLQNTCTEHLTNTSAVRSSVIHTTSFNSRQTSASTEASSSRYNSRTEAGAARTSVIIEPDLDSQAEPSASGRPSSSFRSSASTSYSEIAQQVFSSNVQARSQVSNNRQKKITEAREQSQRLLNVMVDLIQTFFRDYSLYNPRLANNIPETYKRVSSNFWQLQGLYMLLHLVLELTDILVSHFISYFEIDRAQETPPFRPRSEDPLPSPASFNSFLRIRATTSPCPSHSLSTVMRSPQPCRHVWLPSPSRALSLPILNRPSFARNGSASATSSSPLNSSQDGQEPTRTILLRSSCRTAAARTTTSLPPISSSHPRTLRDAIRSSLSCPIPSNATEPRNSQVTNGSAPVRSEDNSNNQVHASGHASGTSSSRASTTFQNLGNFGHIPVIRLNDGSSPALEPERGSVSRSQLYLASRSRPLSENPNVTNRPFVPTPYRFTPRLVHPRLLFSEDRLSAQPLLYLNYTTNNMNGRDTIHLSVEEQHRIHRIQLWDFSRGTIPDIAKAYKNLVVAECIIHNDASIDVSSEGDLLVALLPGSGVRPLPHLPSAPSVGQTVGVYSLLWDSLGQLLYITSLERAAVSVALSPTAAHLLVGLTARRTMLIPSDRHTLAHVFRLEGGRPGKNAARGRLNLLRSVELQREDSFVNLNCIRWTPVPGQGIVYGTNTGQLKILR